MTSVLLSTSLLEFQLFDWLEINRDSGVDRETGLAMIDMAERLASERFRPKQEP